ncbi:hypothetical protein ACNOYE_34435 [Nannocystaceae bacterium ST9]
MLTSAIGCRGDTADDDVAGETAGDEVDTLTGDGDATTGDGDADTSAEVDTTGDGDGDGDTTTTTGDGDTTTGDGDGDGDALIEVTLVPQPGVVGTQRINFGLPLPDGAETADVPELGVTLDAVAQPIALRGLSRWPSGAWRSVQIQLEVDASTPSLIVDLAGTPQAGLELVPVEDTLVVPDGTEGPRVWVLIDPAWSSASRVFGPLDLESDVDDPWATLCDYETWGLDAFVAAQASADVWLYDRPTALYRGHLRQGDAESLRAAYIEAAIYFAGMTGSGDQVQIPVPAKQDDLKYHYTQGLAFHYLLTGDDRFRERAEDVGERLASMWPSPGYAGGDDFWTERHAGFALLGYVWAEIVSDDQADEFASLADEAAAAYADVIADDPSGGSAPAIGERCFMHSATAHGEDFGTWGCSPWMSAILAEGIDAWAGEREGAVDLDAGDMLISLGRSIALHGLDGGGKPTYWMAFDGASEIDDYDEHWGESAYVLALAQWWDARLNGAPDPALVTATADLTQGTATYAEIGQLRSFNWQCRAAPMTHALVGEAGP